VVLVLHTHMPFTFLNVYVSLVLQVYPRVSSEMGMANPLNVYGLKANIQLVSQAVLQ